MRECLILTACICLAVFGLAYHTTPVQSNTDVDIANIEPSTEIDVGSPSGSTGSANLPLPADKPAFIDVTYAPWQSSGCSNGQCGITQRTKVSTQSVQSTKPQSCQVTKQRGPIRRALAARRGR